ncbi:ArdC-like ssDNA-binding domain-containing protein, partial [Proteus mirabilis]|uniref:ArdC-like ssDNA-binding domain-containing protein n=1 Tax=Proteus mirabilis TaxID=584 RepID=UPI00391BFABF
MKKSDRKRRPAADKPVRDIYQEVTDRSVAALEKGTRPWNRPWRPAEGTGTGFPVNALTGHSY